MRTFYQFFGGPLNGNTFVRSEVEEIADGHSPDRSFDRAIGRLVQREELDCQPTVPGYLGPMWDGERYILDNGMMVYTFEKVDFDRVVEIVAVLRYETQEVYNSMCN